MIIDYCKVKQQIICYGAGLYGKMVCEYLFEKGICIECFAESKDPRFKYVMGFPVRSLSQAIKLFPDASVIVCAGRNNRASMLEMLNNNNINDYYVLEDEELNELDNNNLYNSGLEKKRNIILLYHRILDKRDDVWNITINKNDFKSQLTYLKDNYNLVSLEEYEANSNRHQVLVTIDDGYVDFYNNAVPIINELQIPVTIFVSSDNIGINREFWWDELEGIVFSANDSADIIWKGNKLKLDTFTHKKDACYIIRKDLLIMNKLNIDKALSDIAYKIGVEINPRLENRTMNENELRSIDANKWISIGAHTASHSRLKALSYEEQKKEMMESKKKLEKILEHSVDAISFPFGGIDDYNQETIEIALNVGFHKVFAVYTKYFGEMYRHNPSRISISSENTGYDKDLRKFKRLLTIK